VDGAVVVERAAPRTLDTGFAREQDAVAGAQRLVLVGRRRVAAAGPRYLPQFVGQVLVEHDPIFLVTDDHDAIVRMQVCAAIFHLGLLRVKVHLAP